MRQEISFLLDFLPGNGQIDLSIRKITDEELREIIDLFLHRQYRVRALDLSGNQIGQLPETLFQLTSLQKLIVEENRLTEIPDQISRLTNLQILSLEKNFLSDLPDSISDLVRLIGLNVKDNQLTRLPNSIGKMKGLMALSLVDNRLMGLPMSITDLDLQTFSLYLSGNPDLLTVPVALEECETLDWPDRPAPIR